MHFGYLEAIIAGLREYFLYLVRLLREELTLLQQHGSYVGEVVKVMGTKRVLVKVHPEGKYGTIQPLYLNSTRVRELY